MASSPNEPNSPFRFLDYVAIYLCYDLISAGVIATFAGLAGAWFSIMLGVITWWLYEGYVNQQIARGER